jgi:acetyl-CoA carboxylase carboxyl transferase subunit beta
VPWFIKPKTTDLQPKPIKDDIWVKCDSCNAHVFKEDWCNSLNVCPKCGYHGKLTSYERIGQILDLNTFREMFTKITPADPLNFSYSRGTYKERIAETRQKTGLNESVVCGTGKINEILVSVAVMDFRFFGGSLGCGAGEKILRAANYSYEHKIPYIIFSASGGARMHEGILSLMQMAKTCAGIARLRKKNIPYLSVLTDPTTGGVSASFAMVGDINIAEPGALVGFAGRRVIEQTIKQKLPDNFQTSEYNLEHGFIDMIVERKKLKETLTHILQYYNP